MEWMFEAKAKIEGICGIWHKDFGNCDSKLFQNMESYDMGIWGQDVSTNTKD